MAKRNADLIGETAAVLLKKIQELTEEEWGDNPDQLKALAEAFALVAEHDSDQPWSGSGGKGTVL